MRKGQGISINVIVIAALALIILVILSTIVIQKIGGFNRNSSLCTSAGGTCVAKQQGLAGQGCNTAGGEAPDPSHICLELGTNNVDPTKVCCISTR